MHSPRAVELPMAPQKPMVVRVPSEEPSKVARRLTLHLDGDITPGMVAATLVGP